MSGGIYTRYTIQHDFEHATQSSIYVYVLSANVHMRRNNNRKKCCCLKTRNNNNNNDIVCSFLQHLHVYDLLAYSVIAGVQYSY